MAQELPHYTKGIRNAYNGMLDVKTMVEFVNSDGSKSINQVKRSIPATERAAMFGAAVVTTTAVYTEGWVDAIKKEIADLRKPWNIKFQVPTKDDIIGNLIVAAYLPFVLIGCWICMTMEPVGSKNKF